MSEMLFSSMRQLPLELSPESGRGLQDLLLMGNPGLSQWLHAWHQTFDATDPDSGVMPTPAYMWGPAGCGKTHLLHALASQVQAQDWQVLLLDAQGLQGTASSRNDAPTLVLLDDCHALDDMQQHWAFTMFIEAAASKPGINSGVYIIAAANCPPIDLSVRDDLRTRLASGWVQAIEPLPEEGVKQVLLHSSHRRGLNLAEGVLSYMLTRFDRNLAHLMPLLDRLDRYGLAEKRTITVPLLKQMLAQEASAGCLA